MKTKFITIVGPTGSGKTALAIELAQQFNGEIICADSRTIYQDFNIGTAKPDTKQLVAVPHYGLNLIKPGSSYSASQFKDYVAKTMQNMWVRGKNPFLVGGSGLYIDAVLFDYQFRNQKDKRDFSQLTNEELIKIGEENYPEAMSSIDHKNRRRLEQLIARGPAQKKDRQKLKKETIIIGLTVEKALLKEKLEHRIDEMLNNNLVQETKDLINRYGIDCPQLRIIGYRAMTRYILGEINLEEAKQQFLHDDLELARRQMTWFRRNPYIQWINDPSQAQRLVKNYLDNASVQ
ncbi:MAG TPA: tRNA (adenosine(37)-N6)-dimethylallyltransferase MiaA [Gammaproteobacteria bacterium]|nr:tRNA (adenosine(37)-N6)-dimethylallyltransferase MiaA [Gammaproteobacteria bacterium]